MILMLVLMFHHLAHGLQEVLEDYVHIEWLKLASIAAVRFGSVLLAAIGIFAVLRIAI
jgi:succinate dehydrogenase / fumarate reductase membrane anchor subunit